jgi:hypothetical protein
MHTKKHKEKTFRWQGLNNSLAFQGGVVSLKD